MNITAFYIAAAIAIIATVLVITRKNAVHALLYFAISLLAVAVILYGLGAPFIAALEVIIYAGSIIVLFIFVVMMLNLGRRATIAEGNLLKPRMWVGPSILGLVLVGEVAYILGAGNVPSGVAQVVTPKEVGMALYGPYLVGVELSSLLLMAALVGAYHVGWQKRPKLETQNVGREYTTGADAGRDTVRAGSGGPAGAA